MSETGGDRQEQDKSVNRHYATSRAQCIKMGKLNGWTFIKAIPAKFPDSILKVECFFEGEQTSFIEDD